jgi:hypothetical protein
MRSPNTADDGWCVEDANTYLARAPSKPQTHTALNPSCGLDAARAHLRHVLGLAPQMTLAAPHCAAQSATWRTLKDRQLAAVPDAIVLEFHTENVRTTTLREPGAAAPLYAIKRSHDLNTTQLYEGGADAGEAPIAKLVFRTILSDTVALRGEPATRVGDWLHSRKRLCVPRPDTDPRHC